MVFGTVLFGRTEGGEGLDRMMGLFINTLPVRVRVGERGVEASVREAHTLLVELLRHEHASLALAQRCSGVEAPAPLFSSLLNYRHREKRVRRSGESREGLEGIRGVYGEERTNYPVTLSVDDVGEGFWLVAQVESSAGAGRVCGMMHRALEGLVEALETEPERAVGSLDVLLAAERVQVVEEWNRTEAVYPSGVCVHELFEAQVERSPDTVAVVYGEESVSYGELNARANRLAHDLRERGVEPDTRVAILMPRSIELVVAELAVLKAGGAYMPLDSSHPPDRLTYMVADSGSWIVLSLAGEEIPDLPGVERINVEAVGTDNTEDVHVLVESEAVAYVMYTSGSTGEPKGVMVPHRAITQLVLSNGYVEFNADDRVALAANPAFDATTMEVWGPLLNGGWSVVVSQEVLLDPEAYGGLLRDQGVTALLITPVLFNQYMEVIPDALAGLRYVLTGGDRADPASYGRILDEGGPVTVYNCYGPTETTTFSIVHEVECVGEGTQSVPIGRPVGNTRIYVLDEGGEPVPVGVAGELYIGGAGVARGYAGRAGLTAERFVADPFSGDPGARLYRTGDVGRWSSEGTLEFMGRRDFQVKVRGHRIELGEIEARLGEHGGVREVVVMAREDVAGDKRLVAYWVGEEGVEAEGLRSHLSERLPAYMVPAAYVRLKSLPLTPNGKVDRRALPVPEGDAYARRGYEAPVGEVESALAEIWEEVLGVERVGRWDHFFELGGHSLLAVQVISRVRQVLEVEVALGELFARPVLGDFARILAQATRAELPPIEPVAREGRLALSFAQQRLWFLEQLGDLGSTYHIPKWLRLKGALDRDALHRALERIVTRHEALRTTFQVVDGAPEQRIVGADIGFQLMEHDLGDSRDAGVKLRRLISEETGTPFDLEGGPLIRGRLICLAEADHVLLLTMHHIVSDGWSMGVLTHELSVLYGAFSRGEADPLPPLEVQYADYAAWQRKWVEGGGACGSGVVLAGAVSGGTGVAGAAGGPCAAGGARPHGWDGPSRTGGRTGDGTEGAQPPTWDHTVHDVVGGVGGGAQPVVGPGGGGDRESDGESGARRDRGVDRVFPEYVGAAGGSVGFTDSGGTPGACEGTDARSAAEPGHSLRAGVGVGAAGA